MFQRSLSMAFTACSLILIGTTPTGWTHKGPFVLPPHMAAADADTERNFNEKNLISNNPLLFLQVSKDDRSDIESSSDEEETPPANHKQHSSSGTANGTNKNHGTNGYLTGATYPDEH